MSDFTFLKGNIETIILCGLQSSDKYGWEIAKDIKQRTGGKYEIKQPTLYAYLKRLENNDLINSYWGSESNGGRRRYYALTEQGRQLCQQFTSEWQYQQNVLNSLIDNDTDDTPQEFSQENATPLFGSKVKANKKRQEATDDDLDEIERRLNALSQQADNQNDAPQTSQMEDDADLQTQTDDLVEVQPSPVVEDVQPQPTLEVVEEPKPQPVEEPIEKYVDLSERQDTESFLSDFEKRLQELSQRNAQEENKGDDYQNVLMGVLGNQLDEMANQQETITIEDIKPATATIFKKSCALEDVADTFATKGIRMRIYNKDTAKYTPQTLICKNKVSCLTSWIVYLFYVVSFAIMWASTAKSVDITVYAGVLGVLMLAPLAFSVIYLLKPIRAPKTTTSKNSVLLTSLTALGIIVLWTGIVILTGILDFQNTFGLVTTWLIPLILFLGAPLVPVTYNALTNYYTK